MQELFKHSRRDNLCSSLQDGMENPCSSGRDGVGFLSLGITERLITSHLTMLSSGWPGFSKEFPMVKWAGINLSVIPGDERPMLSCTELHGFSMPSCSELHGLSR